MPSKTLSIIFADDNKPFKSGKDDIYQLFLEMNEKNFINAIKKTVNYIIHPLKATQI